jgi:hypothetical protein
LPIDCIDCKSYKRVDSQVKVLRPLLSGKQKSQHWLLVGLHGRPAGKHPRTPPKAPLPPPPNSARCEADGALKKTLYTSSPKMASTASVRRVRSINFIFFFAFLFFLFFFLKN